MRNNRLKNFTLIRYFTSDQASFPDSESFPSSSTSSPTILGLPWWFISRLSSSLVEKSCYLHNVMSLTNLRESMYVWSRTSRNGRKRLNISQISTILIYEVVGRLLDTKIKLTMVCNDNNLPLINMVVRTNMAVRLTVTTASKKKSCKDVEAFLYQTDDLP